MHRLVLPEVSLLVSLDERLLADSLQHPGPEGILIVALSPRFQLARHLHCISLLFRKQRHQCAFFCVQSAADYYSFLVFLINSSVGGIVSRDSEAFRAQNWQIFV